MELAIGRLKGGDRRESIGVVDESGVNDLFKNFGDEVKIGKRTVA